MISLRLITSIEKGNIRILQTCVTNYEKREIWVICGTTLGTEEKPCTLGKVCLILGVRVAAAVSDSSPVVT